MYIVYNTRVCLQVTQFELVLGFYVFDFVESQNVFQGRTNPCTAAAGVRHSTNSTLVNSIFTGHLLRLDSTLYALISLRVTTAVVANRLPETNYERAQKQTSTVIKQCSMMWIIECRDLFLPLRLARRCQDRKTP